MVYFCDLLFAILELMDVVCSVAGFESMSWDFSVVALKGGN